MDQQTAQPEIATVSRVNNYLKRLVESRPVLQDLWVKGELSNYKQHSSGHLYFTLKDEGSVLKSIMFRAAAAHLPFEPDNGMKVVAHGHVAVWEAGGEYQLYVDQMKPDGVGDLFLKYEELKKKLASEGLFDERHKKPLPQFPRRIGIVTAPTGAAVRDIIHVCTRRWPLSELVIFPALVQGVGAKESIVQGIQYFNQSGTVDVLIVGRGGGSIEDLWAFNEETVARAIFESHIPVVSAVGHETDFTIADFVADRRAPTPSAAAEICVPSADEIERLLTQLQTRMSHTMSRLIERGRLQLKRLQPRHPQDRIDGLRQRIDMLTQRMESHYRLTLNDHGKRLGLLSSKLDALSPLKTLSRGYAIPLAESGAVLRSKEQLPPGTPFTLTLGDGSVDCQSIKNNKQ